MTCVKVNWNLPTEFNDTMTCVSWTLTRLLRFYGIEDPTLVFGCGLGFRMDRATQESLWWPPHWVGPARTIYGLDFREFDAPSFEAGLDRLVERLQEGHPSVVVVDASRLPFSPYFGGKHFGHCITVVGCDAAARQVTIVDASACRYLGPLSFDDFRRAMDITILPRGNSVFRWFELLPPPAPPSLNPRRVRQALEAGCRGLRGEGAQPGMAEGIAGIGEYAAALDVLLGRLQANRELGEMEFEFHHSACFFWAEQRMWYARFLREAGQLLGDPAFEAPARLCMDLYEDWRIVSVMFIKALAWDAAAIVARMQRRLREMAELEGQTLAALERLGAGPAGDS